MSKQITIEELAIKMQLDSTIEQDKQVAKRALNDLETSVEKSSKSMINSFAKFGAIVYGLRTVFGVLSSSMNSAISRVDTMNNYTNVMSNLGIASEKSEQSIQMLSEQLKGLPTTLNDAVQSVTRFTSVNGNVLGSTELFLGLNNAILAGNAPIEQQRSAMEQLSQAYAKGKPDMFEWRAAQSAMPAQLKQIAEAMGFVSSDALGEALRSGSVSMQEFMMTIRQLNTEGINGFLSFEEQARNSTGGIATSIANFKTAITRGLADVMNAFGQVNIAGFFNTITSAINTTANYAVAFVMVLKNVINSIASLFGGTVFKDNPIKESIEGSQQAIGGMNSGIADTSKGLTGATKKAKELNKELAGFDNIQKLQDKDSLNGGGGSGGGASMPDLTMPPIDFGEFESSLNHVNSKIDDLYKKMMRAINTFNFKPMEDAFRLLLKTVEPIIATLGSILGYLYTEIMMPLAHWTISDLLPAFINLLSGALRLAEPIINSVAIVGKFLFDVFLIPAAKFAGGVFVATIETFALVLRGLGTVLSNNQPIVVAATAAIGLMIAAYQVNKLVAFVNEAGGLAIVIKNLTGITKLHTLAKESEFLIFVKNTAMLAKETIERIALTAAVKLEEAALNGSVVAKYALTAATKVATIATTAFGAAMKFLSGPIGWITLAIGAVVGAYALYKVGADDAGIATGNLSQAQLDLQNHFEGTEERLRVTETKFDKLADETLPKLQENYEDLTRTLAQERLEINTEGLDALGERTQVMFETVKNAVIENTNLMYEGMSNYYAESNLLTEEQEREILDKILLNGEEKQVAIQGHYDAIEAIMNGAAEQGRGLNSQEQKDYQFHLDELNRIAIETITPEHARQIAQLESFNVRKGELNEEERDEYLKLQEERYKSELDKMQTEMGFQLSALERAKNDKIINEEEYNRQKADLINQMNSKEYEMMDKQAREILEMATGLSADQIEIDNEYTTDYINILNKRAMGLENTLTKEELAIEQNYLTKQKEVGDTQKLMNDFNKNWLDKQPDIFKGVYENIAKGMSLQDGINQINKQKPSAKAAGQNVADGVTSGIEQGQSGAINAMSSMAAGIIRQAKLDLEIKSPSRVMRSLFGFVGEGAALGIEDGEADVTSAMSAMISSTLDETSRLKDFEYPNLTSSFEVNTDPIPELESSMTYSLNSIISGYEQKMKEEKDRPIIIENNTTVDLEGQRVGTAFERVIGRNKLRTGGAY